MNPWDIFAWVAAIALSIVVASVAVAVVVALVRPSGKSSSTGIYRGGNDR